jgi:hypothetical protein
VPRRAKAPPRAKVAQTSNRRLRSKTKAPTSPQPAVRAVRNSSKRPLSRTRAPTSPRPAVRAEASSRHLRSRTSRPVKVSKIAATNNAAVVSVPFEQTSPRVSGAFFAMSASKKRVPVSKPSWWRLFLQNLEIQTKNPPPVCSYGEVGTGPFWASTWRSGTVLIPSLLSY